MSRQRRFFSGFLRTTTTFQRVIIKHHFTGIDWCFASWSGLSGGDTREACAYLFFISDGFNSGTLAFSMPWFFPGLWPGLRRGLVSRHGGRRIGTICHQ
jgi:hypothetical protein